MTQQVKNSDSDQNLSPNSPTHQATIGASISIKGDVTGEEDLVICGTIEGSVYLKDNNVLVGKKGNLSADITARCICVEGEVKGEIRGSEQILVKPSGRVTGDLHAPCVVLENSCQFKGSIDMEEKNKPTESNISKTQSNKPMRNRLASGKLRTK